MHYDETPNVAKTYRPMVVPKVCKAGIVGVPRSAFCAAYDATREISQRRRYGTGVSAMHYLRAGSETLLFRVYGLGFKVLLK